MATSSQAPAEGSADRTGVRRHSRHPRTGAPGRRTEDVRGRRLILSVRRTGSVRAQASTILSASTPTSPRGRARSGQSEPTTWPPRFGRVPRLLHSYSSCGSLCSTCVRSRGMRAIFFVFANPGAASVPRKLPNCPLFLSRGFRSEPASGLRYRTLFPVPCPELLCPLPKDNFRNVAGCGRFAGFLQGSSDATSGGGPGAGRPGRWRHGRGSAQGYPRAPAADRHRARQGKDRVDKTGTKSAQKRGRGGIAPAAVTLTTDDSTTGTIEKARNRGSLNGDVLAANHVSRKKAG